MRQANSRRSRRIRGTQVLTIETRHASAVLEEPIIDRELPHTRKFESSLLSQIPIYISHYIGLRRRDKQWRSLKAMAAIPTYMDMSNETRSRLLHDIYAFGNTPSALVARALGLTAKQVGAIRRWNNPEWRAETNRHINGANNFDRLKL